MTKAPINANDILAGLSPTRRAKVLARGRQLIAEEKTLCQLREARNFTQARMAEYLRVNQSSISKIEQRTDMLISTLRSYIQAMGGDLHITVRFADSVVELPKLGEPEDVKPTMPSRRAQASRPHLIPAE